VCEAVLFPGWHGWFGNCSAAAAYWYISMLHKHVLTCTVPRVSGRDMVHIHVAVPHELAPGGMHMVHPAGPKASFPAVMCVFVCVAAHMCFCM
jgi:hypothetical protein